MTTNDSKKPNALATIKAAPSLAAFGQGDVEDAVRAGLPNGQRLSSAQVRAAAITARTTDLNPMLREFHVTDTGVMKSAAAEMAWAHEWMRATGEREPEFSYWTPGQLKREELVEWVRKLNGQIADDADLATAFRAFCDALNYDPAKDVAVLCRMYRFSTREAWSRNVQAALLLGTKEEVRAIYGLIPAADHEAWGVVRFAEFGKKDGKDLPADQARARWTEAGAKYNHLERAKKRARMACYRATVPTSAAQMARLREGQRTTTVTRIDAPAPPAIVAPPPMPGADQLPRFDILDGEAEELRREDAAADAAADAGQASADMVDHDADDLDEAEPTGAEASEVDEAEPEDDVDDASSSPTYEIPAPLLQRAREIATAASTYAANGRTTSEKQDKLINMHLEKLTGKSDELRHALLQALTGQKHFGDLSGAQRLALLNSWIRLTQQEGSQYPTPCARAATDVAALKKAMGGAR